ncbi:MAG: GNAT family N-acetyltransferase [Nostocoides sp.]
MADPIPYAETWRIRLEMDEPDGVVAVGVSPGEEVLGFASGGPSQEADPACAWELYAVNVVRAAYGTGLGHDLVAAVTRDRPSHLWVLVENSRARAFYAKEGYVADGAERMHEASGCLEIRMVRCGTAPLG